MKAQRATVELGLLGAWYVIAGLVALAQVAGRGGPDLSLPAALVGVLVAAVSICLIGVAVQRLRAIEGLLPETAQRVPLSRVITRVSLSSALPAVTAILASTASHEAGWALGLAFVALGGTLFVAAVLATHVEHLCGARVWRANTRFYFAR